MSVLALCCLLKTERGCSHRAINHEPETHGRWHDHGRASASGFVYFVYFILFILFIIIIFLIFFNFNLILFLFV
jgi:hypothetical protein